MSSKYSTIQQHEPLRAPAGWSAQEKRFVAQLEEILDDLYSRFNRLGLKDLNGELRGTIIKTVDGVKENSTAIEQSSKSIQLIAKEAQSAKEDAEGALSAANEAKLSVEPDKIVQTVRSSKAYQDDMGDKADKSEIPDVSGLASKSDIPDVSGLESRISSAESTITQQADLISQKVSVTTYNAGLAGKADKSEIPDVSSKVESSEFTQKVNSISAIFKSIGLDGGQTGITSIGPNGLTVSHSNINYTTSLAADGMKIKDSSGNVVGGVYAVGGVAKAAMQSLMNPKQTAFEVTVAPKDYDGEQYGLHLILNGEDIGQIFASSGALRIDTTKQLGLYSKGTSGAILSGNPVSIVSGSDVSFVYDGSNTASLKDMLSKLGSGGLKMACGSSSCSGSSNAYIDYSWAGFTSTPTVCASYSKTGSNWSGDGGALKVYNKTTSGANVIVGGSFSSTRDFDWIAIGT